MLLSSKIEEVSQDCFVFDVVNGQLQKIKGPDNPTRQLLPIMSTKCCSGDGERKKDKGGGGGSRSKTKLCVTKFYVKDGV